MYTEYLLVLERMAIQIEWMSAYQHNVLCIVVTPTKGEMLVRNLQIKEYQILRYPNLQRGMKSSGSHSTSHSSAPG